MKTETGKEIITTVDPANKPNQQTPFHSSFLFISSQERFGAMNGLNEKWRKEDEIDEFAWFGRKSERKLI